MDQGAYLGAVGAVRAELEGADACGACHRGLKTAEGATQAPLPRMADCLVCHARIDPPTSCGFCHAPDTVLKIDDSSMSSHHAEIAPSPDGYILKDLDSTNGTKVNGIPLEPNAPYALKPGDKIRFGKIDANFHTLGDSEHSARRVNLEAAVGM